MADYYGRQEDGGRHGYQGGYQGRDRSRSRDHHGGDFGRGGGFQRRGRGGGGRGGRNRGPRPTEMMVTLNYFPIRFTQPTLNEWVIYAVDIIDVKRRKKIDPTTGKFFDPYQWEFLPFRKDAKSNMEKFPEQLGRRILNNLNKQENVFVVSDGKAICYSNKRLFNKENCTSANPESTDEKGLAVAGRYGPADDGGHNIPQGSSDTYNDYHVRAKRSVEENDPDADRVKNAWYRVRLKEVGIIPITEVMKIFAGKHAEHQFLNEIKQATEVIVKSGQFSVMKSYGKSPRKFYFPEDIQENIMGELSQEHKTKKLAYDFRDRRATIAPNIGLESRLKICSNGNAYFNLDSCLDYFYREFEYDNQKKSPPRPVPVLNEIKRTLAGVNVDFHRRIPPNKHQEVISAIKKLNFHVEYIRQNSSPDWIAMRKEQGWSDEKIRRANTMVRKNTRMKKRRNDDNQEEEGIIWCADDPSMHSFVVKPRRRRGDAETEGENEEEGVTHTIASYFDMQYGIRLRYPNMPCVFIGKREWYPVEFLFQGPGRAVHGDLQQRKLDYYDVIAGSKRIEHIMNNSHKLSNLLESNPQSDLLRLFGIERSDEPVRLKAKVLPEPQLRFQNSQARVTDGKWDLRDVQFNSPADLSSFACINLTQNEGLSEKFMSNLFKIMAKHDITMPQNIGVLNPGLMKMITSFPRLRRDMIVPERIYEAFQEAIKRARDIFLFDTGNFFKDNNVWFKTRYLEREGGNARWEECLIIPPPPEYVGQVGIIKKDGPTHVLNDEYLRIMVGCIIGHEKQLLDPFNFRFNPVANRHEGRIEGKWVPVKYIQKLLQTQDEKIRDGDPSTAIPISALKSSSKDIEEVSMIFVLLPSDDKPTYNLVKKMSQFQFGIPTQCCIEEKYSKQRNPNQYLSNIALKLNTKLMSSSNQARAWNISVPRISDGIPWVNEVPTMVIGISLSHGLGQNSISVIGAAVALDLHMMQMAHVARVQSKSTLVSSDIMLTLTKTLFHHFCLHNNYQFPKRVLVYRNGSSDGDFDNIREKEIEPMRLALRDEMKKWNPNFHCPVSCKSGCIHCTPLITYVVCQTQHMLCMTPEMDHSNQNQNVWSGTCVDDPDIMDYRDGQLVATKDVDRSKPTNTGMILYEDVREFGYDFILTAHGGLKGTSKPIYYRVVLNENAVWSPNSSCSALTKEMLERCTFHQSFQYGTATKAVRAVPVVAYSMRAANHMMGYVNYSRDCIRGNNGDNAQLVRIEEENKDPDNENGKSSGFYYIRSTHEKIDEMEAYIRDEIMHLSLSPYADSSESTLRPPLRPHMCA